MKYSNMGIPNLIKFRQKLEANYNKTIKEIDNFMEPILKWADELEDIIKKEVLAKEEASTFRLPKTPSEKKLHNRKIRNTLESNCSASEITVNENTTYYLDNTKSTRTRAARRALTSKMSQLNIANDQMACTTVEIKNEPLERIFMEKNQADCPTNETFVLSNTASTRTKPVVKKKLLEISVADSTTTTRSSRSNLNEMPDNLGMESRVSNADDKGPVVKKSRSISRNSRSITPIQRESRSIFSGSLKATLTGDSKQNESKISVSSSEKEPARKKVSRAISESPVKRPSKMSKTFSKSVEHRGNESKLSPNQSPLLQGTTFRVSRTPSESPIAQSSKIIVPRTPCLSPSARTSSRLLATFTKSPAIKRSRSAPRTEETITNDVNVPRAQENTCNQMLTDEDKTPKVGRDIVGRPSNTSTPMSGKEKTLTFDNEVDGFFQEEVIKTEALNTSSKCSPMTNFDFPLNKEELEQDEENDKITVPKKKRKLKKKGESFTEGIKEIPGDTVRITRTKSKAIKEMMKESELETNQQVIPIFNKVIIGKSKRATIKKKKQSKLLENGCTPKNKSILVSNNFGLELMSSKSKYHLLLSTAKKLKTPLATLPNSTTKRLKSSDGKNRLKPVVNKRDSSSENSVRSATKLSRGVITDTVLTMKKKKEDEAAAKRQNVIKNKQEELKRKNELKHQQAMKQREKLEQEKYNNMIQSEKEKEERHKLILQERQLKMKAEAFKKKMLTQQKIAETVERRRLEEEARIAKLKEMEAEEQRIALEKQKEQERLEKRAQERLAQKKAREEYELQLKQEMEAEKLKAEKFAAKKFLQSASKMQSASKKPRLGLITEKKEWDYKARSENDYGLEDEHSEVESDDEKSYSTTKPCTAWALKVKNNKCRIDKEITYGALCEYMPCHQKTPDIQKMFNMTPTKRIKRTSSAIWNTPSS